MGLGQLSRGLVLPALAGGALAAPHASGTPYAGHVSLLSGSAHLRAADGSTYALSVVATRDDRGSRPEQYLSVVSAAPNAGRSTQDGDLTFGGSTCQVPDGEFADQVVADTLGDDVRDPRTAPPRVAPASLRSLTCVR